MSFYRALLLAGAVVVGTSSAYADDGRKDIQLRDEGLNGFANETYSGYNNESYEPAAPLLQGRASVTEPPPAGVDVEENSDSPQSFGEPDQYPDQSYEGSDY